MLPSLAAAATSYGPGYCSFPVGEYLILYRVMKPGVCIMHVVHGRRNLESLFGH